MRKLLALGFLVFIAGLALIMAGTMGQGSVSAGGFVFIGPFPIVFGSGPGVAELAVVSVVIGGVMLALLLLWGRRLYRVKEEEGRESIK